VEVVHELDEPDRICPSCGGDLKSMQGKFEEADEIDVVERSFRIVRHKRQKYRCRCGEKVETALGPLKLGPGGRYSIDFAVDVAIAKFADHLHLERQVRQMARDGLAVDSSTLWEQTRFLSRHLLPTYEANHADVLAGLRAKESKPLIDEIPTWMMTQRFCRALRWGRRSRIRVASGRASCGSSKTRRFRWIPAGWSAPYVASPSEGESLRDPVRARHPGGSVVLLVDRVREARRG
jgi:transposase